MEKASGIVIHLQSAGVQVQGTDRRHSESGNSQSAGSSCSDTLTSTNHSFQQRLSGFDGTAHH